MGLGGWTSTWQASSSDATVIGSTDDTQNETKLFTQERGVIEHDWGASSLGSGLSDTGRHKPGAARAFYQTGIPGRLRLFDNSGEDPTVGAALGLSDDGRLWVDTDDSNKLYVYTGSGWEIVAAVPTSPAAMDSVSVDATAISDSAYTTAIGWTGARTLVTPTEGTWRAYVHARVALLNTGSNHKLCRVELYRDSATILDASELTVRQSSSGEDGITEVSLLATFAATAGVTYTFDIRAQAIAGYANIAYGGGAIISGGDAANRAHRLIGHLTPVG